MKCSFLCMLVTLLLVANVTSAQKFQMGIKAGASLTKVAGKTFNDGFDLGYQLGGFAEIDFNKKRSWGIQPEVLFSQTTTKFVKNTSDIFNVKLGDQIKLNYLSIPVLLRINTGKLITLNVGPQFSILVNPHETTLQNGKDAFKSGDLSMVGGLQLNLKTLRVYGRYLVGLNDINDIGNSGKWKNQQLQVGVGLKLL